MLRNVILVLDEATENHNFIASSLEQVYGDEVDIIIEEPLSTKELMISRIQEDSGRIVALILDERLTDTGECDYVGSELAEAYRFFDSKIPIYILTSFPDIVDSNSGDIEYVIDKADLTADSLIKKLSIKLRRHVNIYKDIVDYRKNRVNELLLKQFNSNLSEDELSELKDLQYWRVKAIELDESILSEELKISLDKKEKILIELEDKLKKGS